eukprot:Awhi_evm1s8016
MAVKEMKKQDDAGARRTFKKEVTLLKRMKHPNILRTVLLETENPVCPGNCSWNGLSSQTSSHTSRFNFQKYIN